MMKQVNALGLTSQVVALIGRTKLAGKEDRVKQDKIWRLHQLPDSTSFDR
jgi:hypothetical protein